MGLVAICSWWPHIPACLRERVTDIFAHQEFIFAQATEMNSWHGMIS